MINLSKSNTMEYGVKSQGNGLSFTVSLDAKNSVLLVLYDINGVKIGEYDISDYKVSGNVYSVLVDGLDAKNGFQYEYICDGVVTSDPYRHRHSLKRAFGNEKKESDIDRAVVILDEYDFEGDKQLRINHSDVISYQLHVRGFTNHSSSKVKGKGCFLGIAEKSSYLKGLGINQIEIMPAYDFYEIDYDIDSLPKNHPSYESDITLDANGKIVKNQPKSKINYWGFKDAFYFCPKYEYAFSNDPIKEFKDMVKKLHSDGIEVIMQMFFKKKTSVALICDALKYWYTEYHVDGFHVMGERLPLDAILSDGALKDIKLYINDVNRNDDLYTDYSVIDNIVDVNNGFMISSRRFLKSDSDSLAGYISANRYNPTNIHGINYITCFEGFTLNDVVSYEYKHNEENGENNADGSDCNFSWNCGIEGKSSKHSVKELRIRQIKNALCLLLLSQGTPMLRMGDELMNSQNGNNNPYCQDNDVTWINWKLNKTSEEIFDFTKKLIEYRKNHPTIHQSVELKNMDYLSCGSPDISYHQDMAWKSNLSSHMLHVGIMLDGRYSKCPNGADDDTVYIAYNMHWENHMFGLPRLKKDMKWEFEFSSATDEEIAGISDDLNNNQEEICVYKRSVMVLKAVKRPLRRRNR